MPLAVAETVLAASFTRQLVTIPTDNHWVTAISVVNMDQDTEPVECWVTIGLQQSGGSYETRICTLAQGYCGTATDVFWSGKLIADPGTAIFAELFGTITKTYRLLAVLNPIIATQEGLIVVDP